MRVAIITFSDFNTNYGSMLQALSLKMQIEKLGHNVEFIRYREFNKSAKIIGIRQIIIISLRGIVLRMIAFLNRDRVKATEINFENFRRSYFKHTRLFTSNDDLRENLPEYDCYICGSDQIWNINCLGALRKPYFLNFAPDNKLKIAYAPSMGEYKIDNEREIQVKELLKKIDYISVREKEIVEVIKKLTEKPVICALDPVFLTSKVEWEKLIQKTDIVEPYGVCYFVRRSKIGKLLISRLQKKYKILIYNLSDNLVKIPSTSDQYITVDPIGFLALIKNAKFAVGTSFHLAAFSIIFKIPFLIAGMESNRNRIVNILRIAGCEKNYITDNSDFEEAISVLFKQKFNHNLLNEEIRKSKSFIMEALHGKEDYV